MSSVTRRARPPSEHGHTRNMTAPLGLIAVAAGAAGMLAAAVFTGTSISPVVWYLSRAAGFTLYLLLWLSVVTGLGITTKLLDPITRRQDLWMLHRFATELAFVFLAAHLTALALDPSVRLGVIGVLLPFVGHVRQPWTDIGILTGWGMIAVAVSFSLRRLLHQRGWRLLHYSAFPLWAMALAHGVGAGTDTGQRWAILLYVTTTAVVLFLSLFRLLISDFGRRRKVALRHGREASLGREPSADQGVSVDAFADR